MNREVVLVLVILAGAGLILGGVEVIGRQFKILPEVKRKTLHIVTGLASLSFPWLFSDIWPVAVICACIFAALAAIRFWRPLKEKTGGSLYDVGRRSLGELCFPISIGLVFALGHHNWILYVVPILVLTTADAAAALVAVRYGLSPFATYDGSKSWEGTVIFFLVAFLVTLGPLLLFSDIGGPEALLISSLIGFIGSLIEAASWYGLDNFFVPLGTYFVLHRYLDLNTAALLTELVILFGLLVIITSWSRRTRLDTQASICALVIGFVLWTIGGTAWIVPPVAIFVLHTLLVRLPRGMPHTTDLRSILSIAASAGPWFLAYVTGVMEFEPAYYAYCVTYACQLSMVSVGRAHEELSDEFEHTDIIGLSLFSTFAMAMIYLVHTPLGVDTPLSIERAAISGIIWPIVLVSTYGFDRLIDKPESTQRWAHESAIALVASTASLLVRLPLGL